MCQNRKTCFELKLLNESKNSTPWVRWAFFNVSFIIIIIIIRYAKEGRGQISQGVWLGGHLIKRYIQLFPKWHLPPHYVLAYFPDKMVLQILPEQNTVRLSTFRLSVCPQTWRHLIHFQCMKAYMPCEPSEDQSNHITGAKPGIYGLPFSMENQFSTDYSGTVGPILIILLGIPLTL